MGFFRQLFGREWSEGLLLFRAFAVRELRDFVVYLSSEALDVSFRNGALVELFA